MNSRLPATRVSMIYRAVLATASLITLAALVASSTASHASLYQSALAWGRINPYRAAGCFLAVLTLGAVILRSAQLALRAANSHYIALVEQAADAIVIVQPSTSRILYRNRNFARHLDPEGSASSPSSIHDVLITNGESLLQINARLNAAQPLLMKMRRGPNDDSPLDVELRFSTVLRGRAMLWAYTLRDVSMQKHNELQLREKQLRLDRLAHHDQLTGLPNRHFITSFLPDAIATAKASSVMLGVVFIDLDRFKLINDTQGHETGDKLLQKVAARLKECTRQGDVVVRMGGDEFVVVLVNVRSLEEVTRSAERIIESIKEPIRIENRQLQTSASIGVSLFPRDGNDLSALMRHSDTAMYQAKDRGRNNVQVFTPRMNAKLKQRVAIEALLREALDLKQLEVYYQPFIDLRTRMVVGLEALIRWNHPRNGAIAPDLFIPVAEETGLIIPIGDFVLERVLADMASWRDTGAPLVPVSLNVAPTQLLKGGFTMKIARSLAAHCISPQFLQIEMTERAIFDLRAPHVGEQQQDTVTGLRDLGIKIAIDDFGTGYSSLAYLKNWRVDCLKIDRSFVRDLATDSSDYAIVSAIIAMARHLRIEVIAEGIEGYQQDEILRELGCHQGQGYLYARPMNSTQALQVLGRRYFNGGYDSGNTSTRLAQMTG